MKNLIRRILKEEFQNPEVMSSEQNICDVMTINSWDEIENLLDKMDYDDQYQKEINKIKNMWQMEVNTQSHDKDSTNTYLRMVQNLVCK
jgi:hypothetical protein